MCDTFDLGEIRGDLCAYGSSTRGSFVALSNVEELPSAFSACDRTHSHSGRGCEEKGFLLRGVARELMQGLESWRKSHLQKPN